MGWEATLWPIKIHNTTFRVSIYPINAKPITEEGKDWQLIPVAVKIVVYVK